MVVWWDFLVIYPAVICNMTMENHPFLLGKLSISTAMPWIVFCMFASFFYEWEWVRCNEYRNWNSISKARHHERLISIPNFCWVWRCDHAPRSYYHPMIMIMKWVWNLLGYVKSFCKHASSRTKDWNSQVGHAIFFSHFQLQKQVVQLNFLKIHLLGLHSQSG